MVRLEDQTSKFHNLNFFVVLSDKYTKKYLKATHLVHKWILLSTKKNLSLPLRWVAA